MSTAQGVVGPEQLLRLRKRLDVLRQDRLGTLLELVVAEFSELALAGPRRIVIRQSEGAARLDPEATKEILVVHRRRR